MVSLKDIENARPLVGERVRYTPLQYSHTFANMTGQQVYLKLENIQRTGSFKVRGAFHKILSLEEKEKDRGVIAASAGNHAQGVAFAAHRAHIPSTIVMPQGASIAKIEATKHYGADVLLHGDHFDEALDYAVRLQKQSGATLIHAFDDEHVMAGQGTIGLEILEQAPDIEAVVCPVGGGGLISGIAAAVKEKKPSVNVYGVQAAASAGMTTALRGDRSLARSEQGTIADGIAVKQPGQRTLEMVRHYVDDLVTVEDADIIQAMLYLLERSKQVTEGSGAAALAALLNGALSLNGKRTAVIVSGGNVDMSVLSRMIERGLMGAGRCVHLVTQVPDRPGTLQRLLNVVAQQGANVMSVHHRRIGENVMPGRTEVAFTLETKDHAHIQELKQSLTEAGYAWSHQ